MRERRNSIEQLKENDDTTEEGSGLDWEKTVPLTGQFSIFFMPPKKVVMENRSEHTAALFLT